jgi:HD superfamily phosphohydrolase
VTCNLILHSPDLRSIISESDRLDIVSVLLHRKKGLLSGIVSGPLDADKLDYLLRDSHFCGVKYGVYDLDRLIGTLHSETGRSPSLAVSEDGVHSLEQFVLAKYYLTTQVYHRARLITDQMITRGLILGITV